MDVYLVHRSLKLVQKMSTHRDVQEITLYPNKYIEKKRIVYDIDHDVFSVSNSLTTANITVIFLTIVIMKSVKKFPVLLF
jgi:hypothetical protein